MCYSDKGESQAAYAASKQKTGTDVTSQGRGKLVTTLSTVTLTGDKQDE